MTDPSLAAMRKAHLRRLEAIQAEEHRAVAERENAWRERLGQLAAAENAVTTALHLAIIEASEAGISNREIAKSIDKSFEWVRLFLARERRLAKEEQ